MFERLFKRQPRIIRVKRPTPFVEPLFDVSSLAILKKNFHTIYEADNAFYANNEDGIFRFKKRNFRPITRRVQAVGDPGAARVILDRETLESLASDWNTEILETDTAYFILTSNLVWIAKKRERGVGDGC